MLPPLPERCKLYNKAIIAVSKIPHSVVINLSGKADEHKNLTLAMLRSLLTSLLCNNSISNIGVVACSASEGDLAKQIITDATQQAQLKSQHSLLQIEFINSTDIFVVINQLNAYAYYIGADGGLLHVAAALGLNCVGLYNDSARQLWAPWGKNHAALSTNDAYDISPESVMHALASLMVQ